jgi:hypothetical protein
MANKDLSGGDGRQRLLDELHDWTARADAEWVEYWAAYEDLDRELDALILRGRELSIPVAELAEALSSEYGGRWTPDGVTARIRKINERECSDRQTPVIAAVSLHLRASDRAPAALAGTHPDAHDGHGLTGLVTHEKTKKTPHRRSDYVDRSVERDDPPADHDVGFGLAGGGQEEGRPVGEWDAPLEL